MRGDVWVVVGGASNGGIVVRTGKETHSPEAASRLSTGATVLRLDQHAGRIYYELLDGKGPPNGWVSLTFQGRDLLMRPPEQAALAPHIARPTDVQVGDILEVIGGASKGGIVVRRGKEVYSPEVPSRLSTGAFIQVLKHDAGRVCYQLLDGNGPRQGWVSTAFKGQILMVRAGPRALGDIMAPPRPPARVPARAGPSAPGGEQPRVSAGKQPDQARPQISSVDLWDTDRDHLEFVRTPWDRVAQYCNGELVTPWLQKLYVDPRSGYFEDDEGSFMVPRAEIGMIYADLESLFESSQSQLILADIGVLSGDSDGTTEEPSTSAADFDSGASSDGGCEGFRGPDAVDSEGEEVLLCCHCRLPLGDLKFACEGEQGLLHDECLVEYAKQTLEKAEDARQQGDEALKQRIRLEHDIGWKAARVPHNANAARKLGHHNMPQHLCCLVLRASDGGGLSVDVAITRDPAGFVNLEYLSLALQVRCSQGRDALFSLDPVDPASSSSMQAKRFEPSWLAGTSAGDVLFQADVYLKELSMGEHPPPIVGMLSCLDYADAEVTGGLGWSGREWFVVKKAEVRMSQDGVLMPHVEMGVEAREQVLAPGGRDMEDALITRPNHPLVKYAEDFTRNFNLIAERKSVIYHLRELAKATCLAKFLLESEVELQDSWFELADRTKGQGSETIPQLWKSSTRSTIHEDGEVDTFSDVISGGVDLSMDQFSLDTPMETSVMACPKRPVRSHRSRAQQRSGSSRPSSGSSSQAASSSAIGGSVHFRSGCSSRTIARRVGARAASDDGAAHGSRGAGPQCSARVPRRASALRSGISAQI